MKRFVRAGGSCSARPHGYTLVEMLVATMLTLMLVLAAATVFERIGRTVNDSRATLETMDTLRAAAVRLQKDLENPTCGPIPPVNGDGYIEIIEGPIFASTAGTVAVDNDSSVPDTTVGDPDDIIMLTTRSVGKPFVGLYNGGPIESDVAEVAWFLRGNVLFRRVLLVMPGATMPGYTANYFEHNDISVRTDMTNMYANTLSDLTKRQWRYGHDPSTFPFLVNWGTARLPTLSECAQSWPSVSVHSPNATIDYWRDYRAQSPINAGPRYVEDVMLTNVIGFDVKVWDSGAGTYVDINGPGAVNLQGNGFVYCTWSTHYESNGVDEDGVAGADQAVNGFDDNGDGIIDDLGERETAPFYPVPLRGVQIKIRVFEPDSRSIREVTVVQDFLPK